MSGTIGFTVSAPSPSIHSLNPASVVEDVANFSLIVRGSTFDHESVVEFNGMSLTTTPITGGGGLVTGLTASVPANDIGSAGTARISVMNPGPGGGTSAATALSIDGPGNEPVILRDSDDIVSVSGTSSPDTAALAYSGSSLVIAIDGETESFSGPFLGINIDLGNGNDSINIGTGMPSVSVIGGDGNDTIIAANGEANTLDGGMGDDSVVGGNGNDIILGGQGDDTLLAGSGLATLDAGKGADSLTAGSGNDLLNGGNGADTLISGGGNDTLNGDNGHDSLVGGAGNNILSSGPGVGTIVGGTGTETILSNPGDSITRGPHDSVDGNAPSLAVEIAGPSLFLGGSTADTILQSTAGILLGSGTDSAGIDR
jgi:Ca2+-binding RTX toxin-like protein